MERDFQVDTAKVCVITGAGKGLGRGIATALADEGWAVSVDDIDGHALESLRLELEAAGKPCVALAGDVVQAFHVKELVDRTVERFGRVDALVNNAGVLHSCGVLDVTEEIWDHVVDVNLKGAFLMAQAVARQFVERGIKGRIVNVGSITGKVPRWHELPYCVTKAGLHHMSRVFALELAGHGITVNTISPGSADAGVLWDHLGGDRSRERQIVMGDPEKFRLGIPLGRLCATEDVAAGVSYLLSPGAAHVTGQELFVDGGQAMF